MKAWGCAVLRIDADRVCEPEGRAHRRVPYSIARRFAARFHGSHRRGCVKEDTAQTLGLKPGKKYLLSKKWAIRNSRLFFWNVTVYLRSNRFADMRKMAHLA